MPPNLHSHWPGGQKPTLIAKAVRLAALMAGGFLVLVDYAPEALAFPHGARVDDTSL